MELSTLSGHSPVYISVFPRHAMTRVLVGDICPTVLFVFLLLASGEGH